MMDIIGDIRRDIANSLTEENLEKVESKALDKMDEIKNRETRSGKSPAEGGRWDNRYDKKYAQRRKGGMRSPVTLRDRDRDIERTKKIKVIPGGTELRFRDRKKGIIFGYHDSGINYKRGRRKRQIYPENDKQVPADVTAIVDNNIFRLLSR